MNTLKLAMAFFEMKAGSRLSILDLIVFLQIYHHPESGKSDLCEIIYGQRDASKSSLDRPVTRLLNLGLIECIENPNRASKNGDSHRWYKITNQGKKLIATCR